MKILQGRRKQTTETFEELERAWELEKVETDKKEAEWGKCLLRLEKMPKSQRPQLPYSPEFLTKLKEEWEGEKARMDLYLKKVSDKLNKPKQRPILTLVSKHQ